MSNKDLQFYKDGLTVSNRKFEKEAKCKIEKYRRYYRGIQWGTKDTLYADKTVDNMVFSNIRTIMPAINLQNPKIFIEARKKPHRTKDGIFDTLSASAIFELIINYQWRELEIKRQTDKCLLDALLGPWGIMWMGYTAKTEKIQDGEEIEINEVIKEDSAFAVRISPMDFRMDPEATDSHGEDAGWVARRWIKPLSDVKKDPRYKNTGKLKANTRAKTDFTSEDSSEFVSPSKSDTLKGNDAFDRVEGWDIWDKKNNRLVTIVSDYDKFLQDTKWPLEFDGFPCEILYFNDNPDEQFPLADTEIYLPAQDELNIMRSCQLAHVRNISQRKYIGNESKFDNIADEERKLTHGPDGSIAWANGDPNNAIIPLRDANISQDLYITLNSMKNNIRETQGVGQFEQGVAQKFDTATEPALIAQGLTIRRSERIALLEEFLIHIARKLGKILQQTLEPGDIPLNQDQFQFAQQFAPNKLEKMAGEGAEVILPWLNFTKEDIKGDFNFNMDVGSTAPINQEKRKADVVQLAQLLAGNPFINQEEATKRTLEVFGEKNTDRLMKPAEEVQAQAQQAEEAATAAELEDRQIKSQTDLTKTQMKTNSAERTTLMKVLGGRQGNR